MGMIIAMVVCVMVMGMVVSISMMVVILTMFSKGCTIRSTSTGIAHIKSFP
jgi:hypothetical protein